MLSPLTAKIQLSARSKPKIVHVDKMKPYEGDTQKSWLSPTTGNSNPQVDSTQDHANQGQGDPSEQSRTNPDLESRDEDRTVRPAPGSTPMGSPYVDNSMPPSVESSPCVEEKAVNSGKEFKEGSNSEFGTNSNESEVATSGVNRPTRLMQRPRRYQDDQFDTEFRPRQKTRRREPPVESQNIDAIEQPSFHSRRIRGNSRQNLKVRQRKQTQSNYTARQAKVRLVSPRVFYDSLMLQRKVSHQRGSQDDKDLRRTPDEVESALPKRKIELKVEPLPERRYRRRTYRCHTINGRSN